MKPNPILSLLSSRKVIVSLGALVLVAVISLVPWLDKEQKALATAAVGGLAWKLIDGIALEDAAKSAAAGAVDAAKVAATNTPAGPVMTNVVMDRAPGTSDTAPKEGP